MKKAILVDFDGVLSKYDGWHGPDVLGEPIAGAKEAVGSLAEHYEVVCFTTRKPEYVVRWLQQNGFPQMLVTNEKLPATVIIDDRVIEFCGEWTPGLIERAKKFVTYWEDPNRFGPTGQFPDGKINPSDEGELRMVIAADQANRTVVVHFGGPVTWFGLPPDRARHFAAMLLHQADRLTEASR